MFLEDLSKTAQQKLKPTACAAQTVTLASGGAVSVAVNLSATALLGFIAPAAWDTAALSLDVSADGTNWVTAGVINANGTVTASWASVTPGAAYAVDLQAMLPWNYVRFRSGTVASPVNQTADRAFTVLTRPLW